MADTDDSTITEKRLRERATTSVTVLHAPPSKLPLTELSAWGVVVGAIGLLTAGFFWDKIKPFIEAQLGAYTAQPGGGVQVVLVGLMLGGLYWVAEKTKLIDKRSEAGWESASADAQENAAGLAKLLKGQRVMADEMIELKEALTLLATTASGSAESGQLRADYLKEMLDIERSRELQRGGRPYGVRAGRMTEGDDDIVDLNERDALARKKLERDI